MTSELVNYCETDTEIVDLLRKAAANEEGFTLFGVDYEPARDVEVKAWLAKLADQRIAGLEALVKELIDWGWASVGRDYGGSPVALCALENRAYDLGVFG